MRVLLPWRVWAERTPVYHVPEWPHVDRDSSSVLRQRSVSRDVSHRAKDNVLRELGCIPFDQSRSKIIFFIPFHRNPILDYNLNDPPPEADWSYWYLKLVWDCSFHLINRFIDRILDCVITWTAHQKSHGNLDPGTPVWKQIRFRILCSSWSAIWSNFRLKNPDLDWSKGIQPLTSLSSSSVYKQPWIVCPIDTVVDLASDSSTAVLGYKWQLPRSNMEKLVVSPKDLNENYAFPVGKTRVLWTATNANGATKTCFYHVIVNGKSLYEFESVCFCGAKGLLQ